MDLLYSFAMMRTDRKGSPCGLPTHPFRPMLRSLALITLAGTLLVFQPPASGQAGPQFPFLATQARLQNEQNTMDIVKAYQDGVVYVSTYDAPAASGRRGRMEQSAPQEQSGVGSGFLIDDQGYLLTNHHVVADAGKIRIRLHRTDREYDAVVVGTAPDHDLALLKIQAFDPGLAVPMKLGDSDTLTVGQKAIAMGAPFDLDFTVTEGIISNVGRVIPTGERGIPQKAIQTDAAINPGNSGGPLLNSSGEVIGINTQILAPGGGQNSGIGFAIPINVARNLLADMKAGKTIEGPRLGITGIGLQDLLPLLDRTTISTYQLPAEGVLVQEVTPGSLAEKAGLQVGNDTLRLAGPGRLTVVLGGDIILQANQTPIKSIADLAQVLFGAGVRSTVTLQVWRQGKTRTVQVHLLPPA